MMYPQTVAANFSLRVFISWFSVCLTNAGYHLSDPPGRKACGYQNRPFAVTSINLTFWTEHSIISSMHERTHVYAFFLPDLIRSGR